jgi:hypothetical protein
MDSLMNSKSRKNRPFRRVDSKVRRAALALSQASIRIFCLFFVLFWAGPPRQAKKNKEVRLILAVLNFIKACFIKLFSPNKLLTVADVARSLSGD